MGPDRLSGAVDLHIHTAPDYVIERRVTATQAAALARDAGMAAIVVKSHSTDTSARAAEAAQATGFPVYGGVALNYPVGGLNPYAVLESARQGGRVVWMPTFGAEHFVANAGQAPQLQAAIPPGVPGLRVLDGSGELKPEVAGILDLVAAHDMVLCTGHLSPRESMVLVPAALGRGVTRVVVTHPQAPFVAMTLEQMRELAGLGAYLELTPMLSLPERAAVIRAAGVENCLISSDGGAAVLPDPVSMLAQYADGLAQEGFSDAEVRHLTVAAPSHVLGLEGFASRPELPAAG